MAGNIKIANVALGLIGAAAGGTIGYLSFFFMARQGYYAMILPGTLLGFGCGAASGVKSNVLGFVCGAIALLLGVFIEWRFRPFIDDDSFGYFVAHLRDLSSATLIMIALGALFALWFGRGRDGRGWLLGGKKSAD